MYSYIRWDLCIVSTCPLLYRETFAASPRLYRARKPHTKAVGCSQESIDQHCKLLALARWQPGGFQTDFQLSRRSRNLSFDSFY